MMKIVWTAVIGILLGLLVWWIGKPASSDKDDEGKHRRATMYSNHEEGDVAINDYSWDGRTVHDGSSLSMDIVWPEDVLWEIRLNQDNTRIHTMRAKNDPNRDFVKFKPFNTIEARILPNQYRNGKPVTKGTARWVKN